MLNEYGRILWNMGVLPCILMIDLDDVFYTWFMTLIQNSMKSIFQLNCTAFRWLENSCKEDQMEVCSESSLKNIFAWFLYLVLNCIQYFPLFSTKSRCWQVRLYLELNLRSRNSLKIWVCPHISRTRLLIDIFPLLKTFVYHLYLSFNVRVVSL